MLVNKAGINGKLAPLAELDQEDFDGVFRVNTRGVFLGMKFALAEMIVQEQSVIINIASVQGLRPIYPGSSVYAASKAAVISMTRSAAHEYGQYGVRVVAIAPGPIDTPMLRKADPDGDITGAKPFGRLGSGDDIADAVVWLTGDHAAFVSGCLLTVDGAFMAAYWGF